MVSRRLKEYRLKKEMKSQDLAKQIGISQGSYSDLERGKTTPSSETLEKLIRQTDINLYWLLTGEGPMTREAGILPALEPAFSYELKEPDQQKAFGERLRQVRKSMELSQEDFGKLLGISPGYVSELEAGLKVPSGTLLLLMEYRMGLNLNFLRTGEGAMMREKPIREKMDDQELTDILRILGDDRDLKHAVYTMLETKKQFDRSLRIIKNYCETRINSEIARSGLPARDNNG